MYRILYTFLVIASLTVFILTSTHLPCFAEAYGIQKAATTFSESNSSQTNKGLNSTQPIFGSQNSESIISAITAAGAIFTLFIGILTYRQSQVLKKKEIMKEIIQPLIEAYQAEGLKIAIDILSGLRVHIEHSTYDRITLPQILRDPSSNQTASNSPLSNHEKQIRASFDTLFRFLVKLEYHVIIGLLSTKDLTYFNPIIQKTAEDASVINYMKFNAFPLIGKLHPNLDARPPER